MPKHTPKLNTEEIYKLKELRQKSDNANDVQKCNAVLMLNNGIKISVITEYTDLKRSSIYSLKKMYLDKGIEALKSKSKNAKRLLTKQQLVELSNDIKMKSPVDFGYDESFWTTAILADHVWEEYRVRYKSKTSYYIIFKRVKFTFHKPGRVYEKSDPAREQAWIGEHRSKIQQALADPNTVVLCADESQISTQTTTQKVWLLANEYPEVEVSNKRKSKSIFGFLDMNTGQQYAFVTYWQNMYETTKVLQKLRQKIPRKDNKVNKLKGKKILLIWDNAGWHKGSVTQEYIQKDSMIEQIWFPAYAPDLNPQEHVWKVAKEKVVKNIYIPNVDKTAQDFVNYLNSTYFKYKFPKLGF